MSSATLESRRTSADPFSGPIPATPAAAPGAAAAGCDGHYVKAVTEMGDRRAVVLSQAMYSASGVLLLDSGARLDSRVFERLVQHKLAQPIEQCVTVEGAVDGREIGEAARRLVGSAPLLTRLVGTLPEAARLWRAVESVALPAPMAFRLTLAREQRPALYEHSLRAAAVALFLGLRAGLGERLLGALAAAALFHDIGMLHADPQLFERGRRLDAAARRHLYAHPLTGMLILQKQPEYGSEVAAAVLEHHERLDGTGYPRGLRGEEIGQLGRLLALVEVVLAIIERDEDTPEMHLSLILRMQHRGFDRQLIGFLKSVLREEAATRATIAREADALERIVRVLRYWEDCQEAMAQAGAARAEHVGFLAARIAALRRTLAEAGLMHAGAGALLVDAGPGASALAQADAVLAAELAGLVREAAWQVRQIVFEALRRWPELAPAVGDGAGHSPAAAWIAHVEHVLGDG
jgi:hypothetical protein